MLARLGILIVCRALDIWSTWKVSPSLTHEINPLVRWLGWRGWLILNAIVIPIAAYYGGTFYVSLCALSVIAAGWNFTR